MIEQDPAIVLWDELIAEMGQSERSKARILLQRVQGRERAAGMPAATIEARLVDPTEVESTAAPSPEALPDDLHDLLNIFHSA